ncbi:MAG: GC-type dockerin domain-anchored protein, partial [Planctomycetota bacterium]
PPPPETQNAFPMTDTDGANQTQNWINAIDCGPLGCTPGWSSFQQFPSFCTPSGDWMIRATWTSFDCSQLPGACCDGEGGCTELSQPACDASGGVFQGTGTTCAETSCPIPEGACCLSNNNCLQLTESDCGLLGGDWQGGNTACDGAICPIGAACLPDGSCIDGITQLDADMLGAVFQGVGTECDGLECPAPVGACCVTTSLTCIELEEDQCMLVPNAIWQGPGSLCDGDGDGVPDGMCDPAADCLPDVNDDGTLDGSDFFAWVNAFSTGGPGCDQNGDGECGSPDFFAWVAGFGQGC